MAHPGMDVLIVDDDESDIALIRDAFDSHPVPARLHVAGDGVAALEYLRENGPGRPRPDMILLDLNMPRMDGREMLAAVKQDPALAAASAGASRSRS